jgi:hypothetical protein
MPVGKKKEILHICQRGKTFSCSQITLKRRKMVRNNATTITQNFIERQNVNEISKTSQTLKW